MPAVYLHHHVVAEDEIDAHGHANNLRYLYWMQSAAVAHSAAQGWSHEDYVRIGSVWVVRSHKIKYLQSAYVGDDVVIRTWVAGMKRFSSVRKYRIERAADGAALAAGETEWVLVDMQSRGLAQIPPQLIASFDIVDAT